MKKTVWIAMPWLVLGCPAYAANPTNTTTTEGDVIDAGAGDDWVMGNWADDRIQGGLGNDQLDGLAGNDVIEGAIQFIAACANSMSGRGRFGTQKSASNDASWKLAA